MPEPSAGAPMRRRQWGAERRTRPLDTLHARPSDRKLVSGRVAIILTIAFWLAYVVYTVIRQFLDYGTESFRFTTEAVSYLVVVTFLTFSALMHLVARQGAMERFATTSASRAPSSTGTSRRATTPHDRPRAELRRGARRRRDHPLVGGAAGVPVPADRPAGRRRTLPVRPGDARQARAHPCGRGPHPGAARGPLASVPGGAVLRRGRGGRSTVRQHARPPDPRRAPPLGRRVAPSERPRARGRRPRRPLLPRPGARRARRRVPPHRRGGRPRSPMPSHSGRTSAR